MERKPYLSHSRLNLYETCGEAYRRRYAEGEKIPPSGAALRGLGTHGAVEENSRTKAETGEDLSLTDIADVAATAFEAHKADRGFHLDPDEQKRGARIVIAEAKDQAVRLAGIYRLERAPQIEPDPAWIERRVRVKLGDDATHDLLGVIDLVTVQRRVKDVKTRSASASQQVADTSMQLTWYALTYRVATGEWPAGLDLETLVATKQAHSQVLSTVRTKRDVQVLLRRIDMMLKGVAAGVFLPAPVGSWKCSPKWCGYWPTCPYVNAERRQAAERMNR